MRASVTVHVTIEPPRALGLVCGSYSGGGERGWELLVGLLQQGLLG